MNSSETQAKRATFSTLAALTLALGSLERGNERFASGKTGQRDMLDDQRTAAAGQYPHAAVLSCLE
jgi:hypothetical protein